MVGSMVEWLECCDCDQHDLISKPIRAILLCRWKRCFTALCFALLGGLFLSPSLSCKSAEEI